MCSTIELVPVSQWVYDLYKVTYWTGDPAVAGSRQIRSTSIAASSESHMNSEAWEHAPSYAEYMTFEVVKEGVSHPRVIGSMHGLSIHESGWAHGQRLAQQM
jgi:hypothetical protein